jgi:uncharacterized membrane protein
MRILGLPLHPMLVHFPIAFWIAANVGDAAALFGVEGAWQFAWLMLLLGVGAAVPAAFAGLLELIRVEDSIAPAAARHMLLMGLAWIAYLGALLLRSRGWGSVPDPSGLPVALAAVGFFFLAWGGHRGATLVYRHGVGCLPGAG